MSGYIPNNSSQRWPSDGSPRAWAKYTEERQELRPHRPPQWSPGRRLAAEDIKAGALVAAPQTPQKRHKSRKRVVRTPDLSHLRKHACVDDYSRLPSPVRRLTPSPSPRQQGSPTTWDRINDIVNTLPESKAWALLKFLEGADEDAWADLRRPRREGGSVTKHISGDVSVENSVGVIINLNNNRYP